VNGVKQK